MAHLRWICETCRSPSRRREFIWDCPGCDMETCDGCFEMYAFCKKCAKGRDEEELRLAANAAGYDFEK